MLAQVTTNGPTEWTAVTTITLMMTSGNYLSVTVSYGDGVMGSFTAANYTDIAPLSHTYAVVGTYTVNVSVTNE